MKNNQDRDIALWQFAGFGVVSVLGTLLHFLYDLTKSPVAALVSAVNESTWEHMKLLFFPMLLFAALQSFFAGKKYENFWCVKLGGILLGVLMIPVLFYTLGGIFGTTPDFVNIAIFFVAAAIGFLYETEQFQKGGKPCPRSKWSIAALCLIALLFFVFTFFPPKLPLFQDPVDGSFGI